MIEKQLAVFVMIQFLIMGLSHAVRPDVWKEYFSWLHSRGRAGAFANGFLTLVMGAAIVAFHCKWSGLPIVLSVIGWLYLGKSVAIFLWPEWGLRSIETVETASRWKFTSAGIALIAIAILIGYSIWSGQYDLAGNQSLPQSG